MYLQKEGWNCGLLPKSALPPPIQVCSPEKQFFWVLKVYPDGHSLCTNTDCSWRNSFLICFSLALLFFSMAVYHIDGISCFCWLSSLNPIGSLNPIRRIISSDVHFMFLNSVFPGFLLNRSCKGISYSLLYPNGSKSVIFNTLTCGCSNCSVPY